MAIIPFLASFLVFIVIVYLGWLLMQRREQAAKRRSLAMVRGYASNDVHGALAAAKRQESLTHSFLLGIGTALTTKKQRARIERNALYAGQNDPSFAEDIIIRKVLYLIGGLILGFLIALVLEGGIWWLAVPAFGVFGLLPARDLSSTTRASSVTRSWRGNCRTPSTC